MCFYVYEHERQQMKGLFSTSNHIAATYTNPSIYPFLNPLNLEFYNSAVNTWMLRNPSIKMSYTRLINVSQNITKSYLSRCVLGAVHSGTNVTISLK